MARRIGNDISATQLRETFLGLINDPDVRRASVDISRKLRQSSGAAYAAALIENAAA